MQNVLNYFRGKIELEIEGPFPERILNICAQNNIAFWGIRRISEIKLQVYIRAGSLKRLQEYVKNSTCNVNITRREGVPFFLKKFKRRYVLLPGIVIGIAIIWILTMFIWEIDVTGNEKVSKQEILNALEDLGIGIGSYGPSIVPETTKHQMLLKIKELSWFTINVKGSRATVIVRERIPKPEIIDISYPSNVIANKTGIITKMDVYKGIPKTQVGKTVLQGEILVSGVFETLSKDIRLIHAMADVYARTWYEFSAEIPLNYSGKKYTGKEKTRISVNICGKRINLYINGGISYGSYDKIVSENNLKLPGGGDLPIYFTKEKYLEYTPVINRMSAIEAEQMLSEKLKEKLKEKMSEGEILKTGIISKIDNDLLTVTLKSECEELISKLVKME